MKIEIPAIIKDDAITGITYGTVEIDIPAKDHIRKDAYRNAETIKKAATHKARAEKTKHK